MIEAMAPLLPSEDSDLGDFEVCLFICNTFEGLACLGMTKRGARGGGGGLKGDSYFILENNQINTRLVGPHLDSIIRLVNSHDTAIRTSAAGILHNLIQNGILCPLFNLCFKELISLLFSFLLQNALATRL